MSKQSMIMRMVWWPVRLICICAYDTLHTYAVVMMCVCVWLDSHHLIPHHLTVCICFSICSTLFTPLTEHFKPTISSLLIYANQFNDRLIGWLNELVGWLRHKKNKTEWCDSECDEEETAKRPLNIVMIMIVYSCYSVCCLLKCKHANQFLLISIYFHISLVLRAE